MWCIALGLVCTAMGSAWYHLDPTNATLVWDRLPNDLGNAQHEIAAPPTSEMKRSR
jgi:hypothetical protein